jgi:hypothetical protein
MVFSSFEDSIPQNRSDEKENRNYADFFAVSRGFSVDLAYGFS